MRYRLFIIAKLVILFGVILPFGVFAETDNTKCSSVGYSVFTINGIFTNEKEARSNKIALEKQLPPTFNSQPLTVDYLHNPSHLAGLGDLVMSAYQKIFDSGTVEDYDLVEMLKDASEKVKTQKLLLVAHSQGNFYANSFYDTVAGKQGGVPAESIGVYSVATPSGRVAGGGKWLTSDTDKVIAGIVGRTPFKKIMPPNTHIELQNGDDANGHNFKDVYLKYRSAEIVANIQASLNRLSENTLQSENKSCLSAPELTFAHKLEGAVLAVADPVADTSSDAVALTIKTGATAAVLAYNAGAIAAKTVAQATLTTASSITSAAKSLTSGVANLTGNGNNGAAIINAATQRLPNSPTKITVAGNQANAAASFTENNQPTDESSLPPPSAANPPIASNILTSKEKTSLPLEEPSAPNAEVKAMEEKGSPPKLIFVGLRMSGVGTSPRPSPEKIEAAEAEKKDVAEIRPAAGELPAPALTVPRCAESLVADGCLLATTTIRFEWAPISGALYYSLNKNGSYATTTETSLDSIASDFSDYTFEVAAVGADGRKSATSTKTISVATIPIAINEIAWMGTAASAYDEWLELKNNTGHAIALSQWALESKDGAPRIVLSGSIAPRKYLVLERRGNTITVNSAVLTYGNGSPEWALGNGGEELALLYFGTTLDRTPVITSGAWVAGNNASSSSRKTMERYGSKESGDNPKNWTTWGTNVDFIKNGKDADGNQILGTPGACNSASYINVNGGENIINNLTLTADNCYYISAGVRVAASSTLAVEAGAQVSLNQNNLYIDGAIAARGEEKNPIAFGSFSGSATSNRIIISGNYGTSSIGNTVISDIGGVKLNNGAKVEITNAKFANDAAGVDLNNGSSAIIKNANFSSTTNEVAVAYGESILSIASSTITNILDSDAIGVYNSRLSISSTTVDVVYSGDGVGAYSGSVVNISSTTVSNVSRDGIGIYDSTLTIASSTIKNISRGDGIGSYNNSNITIASTTIDGINRGDGVAIYSSNVTIASSTIENVSDDGLRLYNSTSTISNTLVQNGGANGIDVYGGTANIKDTTVAGFAKGAGVAVNSPKSPVAISGGEIAGNSVGVAMTADAVAAIPDGIAHDNAVNTVVCPSSGRCP